MPPKPRPHTPKKKVAAVGGGERRLLLPVIVAGAGFVLLAVVLGVLLLGGGSDSENAKAALVQAGCTFQTVKAAPGVHSVTTPGGKAKWNTSPPTNGPHYETPAIFGAYTDPLQPAQVVHNLEHGGIFIQYGRDVPPATVRQLQEFYARHKNGTLLAPLRSLGNKIALGAWVSKSASKPDDAVAHVAKCTRFDDGAFGAFFDNYQFKGPERFPASSLTPGS